MTAPMHGYVLLVFAAFAGAAFLLHRLGRSRRADRASSGDRDADRHPAYQQHDRDSVGSKAPGYLVIATVMLAAAWSPVSWRLLPALATVIAYAGGRELADSIALPPRWRSALPAACAGLVVLAAALDAPAHFLAVWLIALLVGLGVASVAGPAAALPGRVLAVGACIGLLPLCLATWPWLWLAGSGGAIFVFAYLTIAAHDAFAQIIGVAFGKRALAPHISPAKTVEGAIGGMAAGTLMATALAPTVGLELYVAGVVGVLITIAGTAGDLTFSAWKRALGIRAYSRVLGPHGGVLDRFDSLLFGAPALYALLWLSLLR